MEGDGHKDYEGGEFDEERNNLMELPVEAITGAVRREDREVSVSSDFTITSEHSTMPTGADPPTPPPSIPTAATVMSTPIPMVAPEMLEFFRLMNLQHQQAMAAMEAR